MKKCMLALILCAMLILSGCGMILVEDGDTVTIGLETLTERC